MTLKQVPTVRTTCSNVELCSAFITVWQQLFNTIPSKKSIAVIVAQHDLETGSGNDCWCWNLANIKAADTAGEEIDYCALDGVWEMVNGQKVEVPPTSPGAWFRAFATLNDGIVFYLKFISGKRYHLAWPAVLDGDPNQFCVLLRQQGYYTAPVDQYSKAVVAYYNKFMADTSYDTALAQLSMPVAPPVAPPPVIVPVIPVPDPTPIVPVPVPTPVIPATNLWTTILNLLKRLLG